ncbi:hypothetical protein ACO0LG_29325, partial [Undibacterium sp. Ji42W]|uniref:hypothetical protein n=1 Tax=Undibacterium sp. Ji42W TaxID=3413039 RepID=UPI003BEFE215
MRTVSCSIFCENPIQNPVRTAHPTKNDAMQFAGVAFIVPTRVTHEHGIRLTSYLLFRTTTLSPTSCGFLRQRNVAGRRFWLT